MVDRIGPTHGYAEPIEHTGEMVELAFRLVHQHRGHPLAAKRTTRIGQREIREERRLVTDVGGTARRSDDDLLQRVPLVPGTDGRHAAGARRRPIHSALIFAALMIGHHFSVSALW